MRGSMHCTFHPCLSLTRPVSGDKKWLGIRLHMTGVNIWTSSLGGHWGTGFLWSLRNMAAEMGIMFWIKCGKSRIWCIWSNFTMFAQKQPKKSNFCTAIVTFSLPSSTCNMFWLDGKQNTAGKSLVLGSTWNRKKLNVTLNVHKLWSLFFISFRKLNVKCFHPFSYYVNIGINL